MAAAQTVVQRFEGFGYFMPRCLCSCQQKAQEERKAMEEQRERIERIKCRKAHAYVEHWKETYRNSNIRKIYSV